MFFGGTEKVNESTTTYLQFELNLELISVGQQTENNTAELVPP